MVAPASAPRAIIDKSNGELFRALGTADAQARLADLGMTVTQSNSPEAFVRLIRDELKHWVRFVKAEGIRVS